MQNNQSNNLCGTLCRFSPAILVAGCLALLLPCGVNAGERVHGVSIFGPKALKYAKGEPFEYLNPDAPIAGNFRIPSDTFTKLTPFGITGSTAEGLDLHCFEPLGIKSWDDDEAYSVYGLIAESFEIADDRLSMTIYLRPEARFADGHPITAEDVLFSYELLYDPDVNPAYRLAWKAVDKVVIVDEHTVRAEFKMFTRDLPVTVSRLVIYPKHIYGRPGLNLGKDLREELPVGSGPYRVESYVMGERIRYVRREDYWGKDLPYCKGYLNWKSIEYQVFFEGFSQFEALKGGLQDFKCWFQPDVLEKLDGDGFRKGYIKREFFPITRPSAMKCLVFNLRKPMFQDIELRKVLISLYDFDYFNRNFAYGKEERLVSYFNNQPQLRAAPGPATGRVREVLQALAAKHNTPEHDYVPAEAISRGPYELGQNADGVRFSIDERVYAACTRLDELGWKWDPAQNVRVKDGVALRFEITDDSTDVFAYSEVCKSVGIGANVVKLSPLEEQSRMRNFMFDVTHGWFDGRKAPGRELAGCFLSTEADIKGSANTLGLRNPAIDEILEELSSSYDHERVELYAKVFDRIMCANWYVLPRSWPTLDHAVYWRYLRKPDTYAPGLWTYYNIWWYWWFDEERYQAVQEAIKAGTAVEF